MEEELKKCVYCDTDFILKRSDQKFCSDKCRSRYHNKKNLANTNLVKKTNKELLKDYQILNNFLGTEKEVTIPSRELTIKGFTYKRITHLEITGEPPKQHFAVYDIYFFKKDKFNFTIIRI